jgi:hypothetical protein
MLTVEALEKKFADFYDGGRKALLLALDAAGERAPLDKRADEIIKAMARATAAATLPRCEAKLREAHAESPQALAVLLGADAPPGETHAAWIVRCARQKAAHREFVENQVADDLARATVADLEIGWARRHLHVEAP